MRSPEESEAVTSATAALTERECEEELAVTILRGLANLDVLLERAAQSRMERLRRTHHSVLTGATRHIAETGHELRHGCCARVDEAVAA